MAMGIVSMGIVYAFLFCYSISLPSHLIPDNSRISIVARSWRPAHQALNPTEASDRFFRTVDHFSEEKEAEKTHGKQMMRGHVKICTYNGDPGECKKPNNNTTNYINIGGKWE